MHLTWCPNSFECDDMFSADLAALEAVDEELVLYSSPAANAQPWTNATAAERAAAEAGIVSQIRAVCQIPCTRQSFAAAHDILFADIEKVTAQAAHAPFIFRHVAVSHTVLSSVAAASAEGPGRAAAAAVCGSTATGQPALSTGQQHVSGRHNPFQAAGAPVPSPLTGPIVSVYSRCLLTVR